MNTRVEFKSAAFPKYPNEDAELVNSNCWGKRLAEFVRDSLPKHGIPTEDILCEDWGWLVNVKNPDFPLWIACGVQDEFSDSDEDSEVEDKTSQGAPAGGSGVTQFCVFVTAEPSLIQRWFKRVDTKPAIQKVADGLRRLLESSPDIQDVTWTE
ncbi:MAG: hypothetical protein U1F71_12480 [Verrucomicrobiaceae bacterium]